MKDIRSQITPAGALDSDAGGTVVQLTAARPSRGGLRALPDRIVSPSEKALDIVVTALIQQHGPFGAYDKLVVKAETLRPGDNGSQVDAD